MSYFTFLCFLLFSRVHNRSGFPTGRDVSPAVIPAVFVAALKIQWCVSLAFCIDFAVKFATSKSSSVEKAQRVSVYV